VVDRSALRVLATERLGGTDPCAWVRRQQAAWQAEHQHGRNPNDPARLGWRRLAAMLSEEINYKVSANTLSSWCRQRQPDDD
jgi:hypothetical protein